MSSTSYVNQLIGVVIVLAVLSAMWATITGFITTLTAGTGPEAALGGLIPFFIVLGVVLMIIAGALKKRGSL